MISNLLVNWLTNINNATLTNDGGLTNTDIRVI
jgi:hypothetical protein